MAATVACNAIPKKHNIMQSQHYRSYDIIKQTQIRKTAKLRSTCGGTCDGFALRTA